MGWSTMTGRTGTGSKGCHSSVFRVIQLLYLFSMDSALALVRLLREHPDWLVLLDRRRRSGRRMAYRVPDPHQLP